MHIIEIHIFVLVVRIAGEQILWRLFNYPITAAPSAVREINLNAKIFADGTLNISILKSMRKWAWHVEWLVGRKPKHKHEIFRLSLLAECGCGGFGGFGLGSVFAFRFLLSIFCTVCQCYLFVIPWALVFADTRNFVVH